MDASTRCSATSKRSGERCKRAATPGRGVCRMHGGRTPLGPAAASWKTGRYSKILPQRMLATYHASLGDPDRLALDHELAVIDARLVDVLGRVDGGESGRLWGLLVKAWRDFEAARRSGNQTEVVAAMQALGDLIAQGHDDQDAWAEIRALVRERKAIVESERKRLIEAQQVIGVEQALAVMGLLVDAVRRHVRDPLVLDAVTDEYARLVGRPVPALDTGAVDAFATARHNGRRR